MKPQTARQINLPETGEAIPGPPRVTISNADPGQPEPEVSIPLTAKTQLRRQFKGTRETIRAELDSDRTLPTPFKALLLAELEAADPAEKLLRVDLFRHPLGNGANAGHTITPLK